VYKFLFVHHWLVLSFITCLLLSLHHHEQPTPAPDTYAELVQKIDDLSKILAEQSRLITRQESRFDKLEKLWSETKQENKSLKEALQEKERELINIRERMNDQEQYTRSWCIRVLNLSIPQEDSTDP
jgi:septal ring factor EnvC (AmiA/AmiB activator)